MTSLVAQVNIDVNINIMSERGGRGADCEQRLPCREVDRELSIGLWLPSYDSASPACRRRGALGRDV